MRNAFHKGLIMAPSLQTIAANQVSLKTLVRLELENALPSLLIRERAATVIQTAYRMAKEARRQRMLAAVNAAWEKFDRTWPHQPRRWLYGAPQAGLRRLP